MAMQLVTAKELQEGDIIVRGGVVKRVSTLTKLGDKMYIYYKNFSTEPVNLNEPVSLVGRPQQS
jgi:hypothetical protein